jgi:hypothetical protein
MISSWTRLWTWLTSGPLTGPGAAPWVGLDITSLRPLDFFGFFLPPLVLWLVVALVPFVVLRWILGRIGAYAFIWHRPLFDAALFVAILGGLIFAGGTRWL